MRKCDASNFVLLSQDCFGSSGFRIHFKIVCFISVKNANGILIEIALNLWIALDSMDILIILILPIHEYETSFHLFVLSISFIHVLQFSVYRSFTSLVKFLNPLSFLIIFQLVFILKCGSDQALSRYYIFHICCYPI